MKNKIYVGRYTDFPIGSIVEPKVEGMDILLFKQHDGKLIAFERSCPHAKLDLKDYGRVSNDTIKCTAHGCIFCAVTGQFQSKSRLKRCKNLALYQTFTEDSKVYVVIPAEELVAA